MVCRVVRAKLFQYLDEELSPYQRSALERHLASCPDCQRLVDLERAFWGTYIVALRPDPAPEEVREQVVRLLDALPSRPPERQKRYLSRHSLAAGIALILLGGFLGFGLQRLWQRATAPLAQLADAAVEQHQKLTRALLPYDIAQVPPKVAEEWFRHRLDFNVSFPELLRQNVTFQGGRISHLRDLEVAALHYRVEAKDVSLFVIPLEGYRQLGLAESPKFKIMTHKGYDVILWTSHGVAYSLVSEIGGRSCLVCHSPEERLDPFTQAKDHL